MTVDELWEESGLVGDYEAWAFGGAPDKLADLVTRGNKRPLDYWRRIHDEYFTEVLGAVGLPFDEGSELVCEEFELAYVPAKRF